MAFPIVEAVNENTDDSFDTTSSASLPANIASGDLLTLVAWAGWGGSGFTLDVPSGWTRLFNNELSIAGVVSTLEAFYKLASGSEGGSVSIQSGGGINSFYGAYNTYRISNYTGTPESSNTNGTDTNPDPPNLSPSWGFFDNLWLAVCAGASTGGETFGAPTNYTNILEQENGAVGLSVASARRSLAASSENPGTFSGSSTSNWIAGTIAIQGTGQPFIKRFGGVNHGPLYKNIAQRVW